MGKAKNLKNRVSSYFANKNTLLGKTFNLVTQVKKIRVIQVDSEIEALLLEARLIKKHSPKYNIRLTDGKEYPLIRITYKAPFPSVLTARKMEDKKSLYFGPFPNATAMRQVLRFLRKTFPYQSVLNHPKYTCLYFHLGLCPCLPAFPDKLYQKQYRKTLRHMIQFLEGKTTKVLQELEKERENASKSELYEFANAIQKQIDNINYVTHPQHQPFEYETNPNLRTDLRMQEMQALKNVLLQHDVLIDLPERIECYDNSNFQGSNPTSSMVVLTNGEIDKSQYRRFRIRSVKGPNDFATMQEVFTRRLRHKEWPMPQLFVVDGGKGQLSSAKKVLDSLAITIPIIGLAKREETIITADFQEIRLTHSKPALQLVMRIRDEAHRFAITYHRKLRTKATFE